MNLRRFTAPAPALAAVAVLALAACGSDADEDTSAGGRTVEVEMVDNAFEPAELTVAEGETVTFKFTNNGDVIHDAFLGDTAAQAEHEEEMGDEAGHHGGGESDAISVEPGEIGTLTYTFEEAGRIEIGCHQPGHYDAGMKSDVTVE
jgi:uncharacterized cupredoxin-like copper-binding protein